MKLNKFKIGEGNIFLLFVLMCIYKMTPLFCLINKDNKILSHDCEHLLTTFHGNIKNYFTDSHAAIEIIQ